MTTVKYLTVVKTGLSRSLKCKPLLGSFFPKDLNQTGKKKKKNTQPHKQKKKKHKTKSVFHMPEESRIALTSKDGQIHGLKDIIRAPYFPALFSVSLFVGPFILR